MLHPVQSLKALFSRGVEQKSVTLVDAEAFELFGSVPTIAGPSVNAATAIRVPAVYSAIVLIAGAIGTLPAKVFLEADQSGKRAAKDHSSYRLVHDEANEWTSAGELRSKLTQDALLHGHGFAYATRLGDGRIVEFLRLDPRSITIRYDEASGEPSYVQRDKKNRERVYPFRDILHIASPLGISPIQVGKEAIGLAMTLERHGAQLFASGARPSGVMSNEKGQGGETGTKTIANILKSWRNWQTSASADPLVLDAGWKYDQQTMTSTDAQFLENRRFQIEEVARLLRIPTPMLFDLSRATWSNSEEMYQQFLTMTLRPLLDAWEWAYARVVLTPEERANGYYVEFIINDLLTANATVRATTYGQYRSMGVMTANEVRAGLNLSPMIGGDKLDNPNITPGKPATVADIPAKDTA